MKGELTSFFFLICCCQHHRENYRLPVSQTANGGAIHRSEFLPTNAATAAVQLAARAPRAPSATSAAAASHGTNRA